MADDEIEGLASGKDETSSEDDKIEDLGDVEEALAQIAESPEIEGLKVEPEEAIETARERILQPRRPFIALPDEDVRIEQRMLSILTEIFNIEQEKVLLQEQRINIVKDQTTTAGSDNAATIQIGIFRKDFSIYYDLETADDTLAVEVSLDGSSWKNYSTLSIPGGGDRDIAKGDTVYPHVRAYPGDSFSDSDVNIVEIVSKGG